jgi:hypothetical protein
MDPAIVRDDLAYPAMLTFLPAGLLGLVVASLAAAYMSTISTHLNWGSSYLVHDVYRRFVKPEASEREMVRFGRISTAVLMAVASAVSLALENALQTFQILLQIGAGTGLLFLLRWFWWRVNAVAEIVAMAVSFAAALWFQFAHAAVFGAPLAPWKQMVAGVALTTVAWIAAALGGPRTDEATLRSFYRATRPGGPGWERVRRSAAADGAPLPAGIGELPSGLACATLGCLAVYAALFATGLAIYGRVSGALALAALAAAAAVAIRSLWTRSSARIERELAEER